MFAHIILSFNNLSITSPVSLFWIVTISLFLYHIGIGAIIEYSLRLK